MLTADEGKLVDDKKLIDTFCIQPATGRYIEPEEAPEEWARFCAYAIRDTEALRTDLQSHAAGELRRRQPSQLDARPARE